jgi:sorting nexin-4
MDDEHFDSVQWGNDSDHEDIPAPQKNPAPPNPINGLPGATDLPTSPQAGPNADGIDLAGVGRGRLETRVSDPQTEAEGTKDAYVSYLVTTDVRLCVLQ